MIHLSEKQQMVIDLLDAMTFNEAIFALQQVQRVVEVDFNHPTKEDIEDHCLETFTIIAVLPT